MNGHFYNRMAAVACAGFMRARAHTTLLHTPLEGSNNTTCLSDLSWTVIWPGALTSRPGEIILGASLADPYLLLHGSGSGQVRNRIKTVCLCRVGSWSGTGFRGFLDPDLKSGSGSRGLKKVKMLNNHDIILLYSDFYIILSFNWLLLMIKT